MISKDNYQLVKKAIKIHNNLKDRMHLIEINGLKSMVERLSQGSGRYHLDDIDNYFKTSKIKK